MHLSEQEIVRRENLQKIKELGFDPFPANAFEVNWKSSSFVTKTYKRNLLTYLQEVETIKTLEKSQEQLKTIFLNKWRASQILEAENNYLTDIVNTPNGSVGLADFLEDIRKRGLAGHDEKELSLAGRFMGQRGPFAQLQDEEGRIQVYIGKKALGSGEEERERYNQLLKLLDIGDFIGVKGRLFATGTGEVSIKISELTFLSKSLRPLPIVKTDKEGNIHDAFTDPELRYRQRYVDLVVNPQVKKNFIIRSKIISTMRKYFDAQGWLEVETPVLQPIHGGAAARPFATHHNTLDVPLYLRIANELYLKRLIVGGFDGVYEIGKMFRNEGMDRTHNPEFTSMEIYVAYKDYEWMMSMVEECLETIATTVLKTTKTQVGDKIIDFKGPYRRLSMYEAIHEYGGVDISDMSEDEIRNVCRAKHIDVDESMGRGKLIDELFGGVAEAQLIQPTYITDYPIEMTPLAKKHRNKDGLVERFELFVNGKEIANAYSELNDPVDQRERFEDQLKLAQRGDDEAMVLDEDFLRALEYGMPPTSGLGIGIDRLTMLLTNNTSIQEVLFFPQMRPEKKGESPEE